MRQLITPTPDIWCAPGWCLQYVREAFGLPARYASATEAWENSPSQHRDQNFPRGLWTPVWYGVKNEPLGHVVLLAPDGSVYSTSDLSNTPHHHTNLADLEWFYAYYGMDLTYRGWTEDVSGYPVMSATSINVEGAITIPTPTETAATTEEDTLSAAEVKEIKEHINMALYGGSPTKEQLAAPLWKLEANNQADIRNARDTIGKTYRVAVQNQVDIRATASRVWATTISRAGKKIAALQELANTFTKVAGVEKGIAEIIENTDAIELAAQIPDDLAQQVVDALAARLAGKDAL